MKGSPFLTDYLFYNSGNEVPASYHTFSLLAISAALLSGRVWHSWNYDAYDPVLYVGLIGPQGLRKSSAAGIAKRLLLDVHPDHPLGESTFSKEAAIKDLSQPDAKEVSRRKGKEVVYEPMTFILPEMMHSIGINPTAVVEWLTAVYDGANSGSNTIKRGKEKVEKPVINLLFCTTTDWIVSKFRDNLLSGGISRRMLLVVEEDYPNPIANPRIPKGGEKALARVRKRLEWLRDVEGESHFSKEGRAWFDKWYEHKRPPMGKFARAWYSSKHVQLIKLAMVLAGADDQTLEIGVKHLELAMSLLDSIEPRMLTLISMGGQNRQLAPCYALTIELAKGPLPETKARRILFDFVTSRETDEILRHLQMSKQISISPTSDGDSVVKLLKLPKEEEEEEKPKKKGKK